MKKIVVLLLILTLAAGMIFAGGSKEKPAETAKAIDLQTAGWDKIVEAAKAEGEVTFYTWYFPD